MILAERWLHPGSVVVADNILVPGAPAYRAHMRDNDGPEPQYNETLDESLRLVRINSPLRRTGVRCCCACGDAVICSKRPHE